MHQILLTIADILLTLGVTLPEDHERSAADSERLLEAEYENLEIMRCACSVEPAAPELHVFTIEDGVHAETALWHEMPEAKRTKMMIARCKQRNGDLLDGDTLEISWKRRHRNQ